MSRSYGCAVCLTTFDNWKKHIKTKTHSKFREKSIYSARIFDSRLISKIVFLYPLLPKEAWRTKSQK